MSSFHFVLINGSVSRQMWLGAPKACAGVASEPEPASWTRHIVKLLRCPHPKCDSTGQTCAMWRLLVFLVWSMTPLIISVQVSPHSICPQLSEALETHEFVSALPGLTVSLITCAAVPLRRGDRQ